MLRERHKSVLLYSWTVTIRQPGNKWAYVRKIRPDTISNNLRSLSDWTFTQIQLFNGLNNKLLRLFSYFLHIEYSFRDSAFLHCLHLCKSNLLYEPSQLQSHNRLVQDTVSPIVEFHILNLIIIKHLKRKSLLIKALHYV